MMLKVQFVYRGLTQFDTRYQKQIIFDSMNTPIDTGFRDYILNNKRLIINNI